MTSSCHHQGNEQVEACIKFVKCAIKKCRQSKNDVHFALFQIWLTLLGVELPTPAVLLLNRPIRTLQQIEREPLNINNNNEYNESLKSRQEAYTKNNDTHKDSAFFSAGSTVIVQSKDRGLDAWCDHGRQQQCLPRAVLPSVNDEDRQINHIKHEAN